MPLVHLPHPELPAYASADALLKAKAVRDHLLRLRAGLAAAFAGAVWPRVTLYLLSEPDWKARLRLPYGYPAARVRGELAVYAPRDVPERLRQGLLGVFAGAGVAPPGPVSELVDLAAGHEYAHAVAVGSGLFAARRIEDELIADGLWAIGLHAGDREAFDRLAAWAAALARLPLPAKGPGLGGELALAGRLLAGCLGDLAACRRTLARALEEKPGPKALRAMLEPWRRSLPPEGSRGPR